jgi:hypothetical protein
MKYVQRISGCFMLQTDGFKVLKKPFRSLENLLNNLCH